jgi:molybdopterin converting factor small subunit
MPTIKLYANLRNIAGTKELSITPPSGMLRSGLRGANLGGVLNELVKQVPALDGVILENGRIRPHFVITINGHNATELDAPVTEQDLIAIFPPIAGG